MIKVMKVQVQIDQDYLDLIILLIIQIQHLMKDKFRQILQ